MWLEPILATADGKPFPQYSFAQLSNIYVSVVYKTPLFITLSAFSLPFPYFEADGPLEAYKASLDAIEGLEKNTGRSPSPTNCKELTRVQEVSKVILFSRPSVIF